MPTPGDYEFVQKALERRMELEREIERINMSLALFENVMGYAPGDLSDVRAPIRGVGAVTAPVPFEGMGDKPANPQSPSASVRRKPIPQDEFAEIAISLIVQSGHPLISQELLKRFHNIGRPIGGSDELGNMTTKLWRAAKSGRIIKLPGGGYWPASIPCPEVGYDPAMSAQTPAVHTDNDGNDPTVDEVV